MTITPQEAAIVLVAIDVAAELGWDGNPSAILLESAKEKLEEIAGGPTPPNLTIVPDESPFDMPKMGPKSSD